MSRFHSTLDSHFSMRAAVTGPDTSIPRRHTIMARHPTDHKLDGDGRADQRCCSSVVSRAAAVSSASRGCLISVARLTVQCRAADCSVSRG